MKTSNSDKQEAIQTLWYQVPILWLCIGILIITLAACAHLIVLSLEHASLQESENASTKMFLPAPNTELDKQ